MPTMFMFVRPDIMVVGEKYYLRDMSADDPIPKHKEVRFIDYDTDPEFVYVVDGDGVVERCAKAGLFQKMIVGR